MAPKMKPFIRAEKHLILSAPDTEFENFLSELDQLSEREPEILDKIEQDLEKYARNKKKERLEDKLAGSPESMASSSSRNGR